MKSAIWSVLSIWEFFFGGGGWGGHGGGVNACLDSLWQNSFLSFFYLSGWFVTKKECQSDKGEEGSSKATWIQRQCATATLPNRMNFRKVPRGGGAIFNPKVYNADFGLLYRAFYGRFREKKNCIIIF